MIGGKYDVFDYGDEPIADETKYVSDQVSVTMTRYDENPFSKKDSLVYFVADIYIQDISSLRAEAAKGFNRVNEAKIDTMSERVGAIISINGDYHAAKRGTLIVRNGTVYRASSFKPRDVCLLHYDGSMSVCTYNDFNPKMDMSDVWQGWQFGPYLINEDGTPRTSFPGYGINPHNPRTVLGYYEPGHYCFVVVDGRHSGYSSGLTLKNLAQLMVDLGCKQAYNLDGGGSTQLYWNGEIHNRPSGRTLRPLTDIIYIAEPLYDAEPPATPEPEETTVPESTAAPEDAEPTPEAVETLVPATPSDEPLPTDAVHTPAP